MGVAIISARFPINLFAPSHMQNTVVCHRSCGSCRGICLLRSTCTHAPTPTNVRLRLLYCIYEATESGRLFCINIGIESQQTLHCECWNIENSKSKNKGERDWQMFVMFVVSYWIKSRFFCWFCRFAKIIDVQVR